MVEFQFYKAEQQPYDFGAITRGAETAAQIRAQAMSQAAANILGASAQRKDINAKQKENEAQRAFVGQQGVLDRGAASMREVARQKSEYDLQDLRDTSADKRAADERAFNFGQGERNNAAKLEDTRVREQGWLDRTHAEYTARALEQQAAQAAHEKEVRAKIRSSAYASQFSQAMDVAHADDEHAPIVSSTKTRGEWLFPGLSESEIDVALKGMYHDPEQAKSAAQYLKGKDTLRVFDPSKANAILDSVQQKIAVPGEEDYAQIGRQEALDNFQKTYKYANDHMEGIDRTRSAFTQMYPPNYKTATPVKETIGRPPTATPISQASEDDLRFLIGRAAKAAAGSDTVKAIRKKMTDAGVTDETAPPEVKAMLNQAMDAYVKEHFQQVARENNWKIDVDLFGAPKQETPAATPPAEDKKQSYALDRYEQYKKQNK